MGNLIAESGGQAQRSLLLVAHAMNQPPSTMPMVSCWTAQSTTAAVSTTTGRPVRTLGL